MTNELLETPSTTALLDHMRGTRDAISVRRVFGDAYQVDDVTLIPVARAAGCAGGGGGEGPGGAAETGGGFGTGFGLDVRPVGVYEVRDGEVAWKPTIDVSRND